MCCILLHIMTNQEYCTVECEDLQIAVLMNCAEYKKQKKLSFSSKKAT